MASPQISIIMNCLNGANDLPQALQSVREQTFQDFEIIFVDNASTDASPQIARAFGKQLKYYRNTDIMPLGMARNQALTHATGEFIAFLDCDDLWLPEKLEKELLLFHKNPSLGLVCTDTGIFNGKKVLSNVFDTSKPSRGMAFAELVERQWISMSSAMLRKEALDSVRERSANGPVWFDERLNVCEEADLFYRIAHDWEIDYVPEALTRWRVHSGNTTFQKFHQFSRETMLILEKHLQLYPDYESAYPELSALLKKRAAFQSGLALWKAGKNREARGAIAEYKNISRKYQLFWLATFLPGSLFNVLSRIYFSLPASLRRY